MTARRPSRKGLARELAERYGVNFHTVVARLERGVTGAQVYEPAKPRKAPTGRGNKVKASHPWRAAYDKAPRTR